MRRWTDEQRRAAADRARARFTKKPQLVTENAVADQAKVRPPEVQAVIDAMPAERKAKLAGIQARTWSSGQGRADGAANAEAIARHETAVITEETVPPEPRIISVPYKGPFRLVGNSSGLMVSEFGSCACGAGKLVWHSTCLKEDMHV